ncbi:MAG: HIRAN domain-containing protein [Deltaproteobacteria bacterium]|nr:HIRAN domain-containing protein [Deltaproteobacteria bacterium]
MQLAHDPLSLWHRAAREPSHVISTAGRDVRRAMTALKSYERAHQHRVQRPAFLQDRLRQQDLVSLGLGPTPHVVQTRDEERDLLLSWLGARYAVDAPVDEPWLERQFLCLLGMQRDDDAEKVAFWEQILRRNAFGEDFAGERRVYSLAALAWTAAGVAEGRAERALRGALEHPRGDIRSAAAVYLLAAHRLAQRGAPMATASALHRMAQHDPVLAPRVVARTLLEADRMDYCWDHPQGAYLFALSQMQRERALLGTVWLRGAQTLAHLEMLIGRLQSEHPSAEHQGVASVFSLAEWVRQTRFDLSWSEGVGRRHGDVALASLGLRVGDQLRHQRGDDVTAISVRECTPWLPEDHTLTWPVAPRPVAVLECSVAGAQFHQARAALGSLAEGDALVLERERQNTHDDRAIAIKTSRAEMLGYIPRTRNRVLAGLMDVGEQALARVLSAQSENDLPVIWLSVHSLPRVTIAR